MIIAVLFLIAAFCIFVDLWITKDMDIPDNYADRYKDKIPDHVCDIDRPYHPPLSDTTFAEAEAYFELFNGNARVHAIVSFNELVQYVMPLDDVHQMLPLIARSTPNLRRPYSYLNRHKNTMPTVKVLTPFEYKCQWLAGYFNVEVEDIEKYCSYTPLDEAKRLHTERQVDYRPPQLDLPLEIDPRVADTTDPEYT